jgi:hypothetical protein
MITICFALMCKIDNIFKLLNSPRVLFCLLPIQSVPITTTVVSSNPTHCEVYSIHHYVIKFVSYEAYTEINHRQKEQHQYETIREID